MRFGKRNKNSLAMGWRGRPQAANVEFSPVASEERDALLYSSPPPEDDHEPAQDSAVTPATRRLATVLGRFEKHVARAREGAPQELWSDECMNQLINAVEIAVAEGWNEVVEALTETGRILQSYENEGQAHLSVPFLTESYEILCQMVSDLFLGKVRTGLMQKWRNRYRIALDELKNAGIRLVRDEEDTRSASRSADWERRAPIRETRFEAPRPAPFEMPAEEPAFRSSPFEAPRMEDYVHEEEEESPTDEATLDAEYGVEEPWPAAPTTPTPWDDEESAAVEEPNDTLDELPPLGDLPPLAPLGSDLLNLGTEADTVPETVDEEEVYVSDAGGTAPEVIQRLDVLCERLSRMEREADTDIEEGLLIILDSVAFLEGQADIYERRGCVDLCQSMTRMCSRAANRGALPDDKFFELAYAFCGVYVEADDQVDNSMVGSWISECDTLLAEWESEETSPAPEAVADVVPEEIEYIEEPADETPELVEEEAEEPVFEAPEAVEEVEESLFDEPVVEEPEIEPEPPVEVVCETVVLEDEPVEEVEPETEAAAVETLSEDDGFVGEESPEALLHVAQRAMTEGNAAEAKRLALQAAAMLAQLEVEEATGRVNDAERRLQEGAELIEGARGEVQRAEKSVAEAAQAVAEGLKTLEEKRGETAGVAQRLSEAEATVADLDEQIRLLQLRRAEEAERLAQTQAELEAAQGVEGEAEADSTQRKECERDARIRLEDARQRVKNLQRKRTEVEAAMERAREVLTRQRLSLADIQQTLAQVGGSAANTVVEPESEEFLF